MLEEGIDLAEYTSYSRSADRPDGLFNARSPSYMLQAERPEHRIIIYLKAQGLSNVEIADKIGKTSVHVATIVKQPWAAERIVKLIQDAGGSMVQQLLGEGTAVDMIQRLITEASEAQCSRDRISAADKVLDRIYGKPNQSIVHHKGTDLNHLSDEELAKLAFPTGTPSSGPDTSGPSSS